MTDALMMCLNQECLQEKKYFYYYPSQYSMHPHHPACHIIFTSFIHLFNDNQLFQEEEIEAFSKQLEQSYLQLHQETTRRLKDLLDVHRTAALEMFKVFRRQKQIEFTKKLEKVATENTNFEYLQIAHLAINQKKFDLKGKVNNIIHIKFQSLKQKVFQLIKSLFSLTNSQGYHHHHQEDKQHEQALISYTAEVDNTEQQTIRISKMEQSQSSTKMNKEIQLYPDFPKSQQVDQHESPYYFESTLVNVDPSEFETHAHEIDQRSQTIFQEHRTVPKKIPSSCELPQKKHKIRKCIKRGRPCKKVVNVDLKQNEVAVYKGIFIQGDMDLYFPKDPQPDTLFGISDYMHSPFFKKERQTSIIIRSEKDIDLITKEKRLAEEAEELTLSQKDIYSPDKDLKLSIVFQLFERSHLIYIHLKDVFLNEEHTKDLKLLLQRNVESLHTLMLEDCSQLDPQITELISTMRNLKKLKLHSGYNNRFGFCLQHILTLDGLQALSLSSADFIDVQGQPIDKDDHKAFKNVSQLKCLHYLTLYNCFPVTNEFLRQLHPNAQSSLTHLNIGITNVTGQALPELKKITNLFYFNVDETQLNGRDLIELFESNLNNKLKELSLWRLSGDAWQQGKRGFTDGCVTRQELSRLAKLLPKLKYINIAHCKSLRGFQLSKFPNLNSVCVSSDMYSSKELIKYQKSVKMFVENIGNELIFPNPSAQTYNFKSYRIN